MVQDAYHSREVALAKPGNSNTTHESLAISVRLMATSGLSVFTRLFLCQHDDLGISI
jgi:hypothetical protein